MRRFLNQPEGNYLSTGFLILVVFLSAACGNAPAPVETSKTETPRGQTMPRTALPMPPASGSAGSQSFRLIDNSIAKLSDYEGQVLVLDFWATYCKPCREETPQLNALQTKFYDQGLRVIGLNVGGPEDHPKIPAFIREFNLEYLMGYAEPEMIKLYMGNNNKIPQTIVLDRRGRVFRHFIGYDKQAAVELERTIQHVVSNVN